MSRNAGAFRNRTKKLLLITFLCACFSVIQKHNASAQNADTESDVFECAAEMASFLKKNMGTRPIKMNLNQLRQQDDFLNYRIPLQAENIYVIAVCGAASLNDLDLEIYNPQGYLEQEDHKTTRKPMLQFVPKISGTYMVRVIASKGHGRIGLVVASK